MVMIEEGHTGPDIWPKSLNQNTDIEDIILTIWSKKTIKQK